MIFDKKLFMTYTQFKRLLKVTVANKQTIDTIRIKTVKLEIYICDKLTLFVINSVWYVLNLICNLFSTQTVAKIVIWSHFMKLTVQSSKIVKLYM
jgi:hypothetical protein